MNKALKTLTKNAGIKTELVTKAGRHTFATTLLTQGADIYTVSELLGHSNLNTTRIYAKIVGEKKRKAVDLLNNILD
jgi:site-specific recombinase XerD